MAEQPRPETRDPRPVRKIAILGVGLIGGSLGMALRANGVAESVVGWDADVLTNAAAIERTAVDSMTDSAETAVDGADLVFLAPPTESIIPLLSFVAPAIPKSAVVTDVGSTKSRIVKQAEEILGGQFVGGHPMAGLEESGITAASPTLFQGAAWILTPTNGTSGETLQAVQSVVSRIGARPRLCDPETHDRIVAFISHLPHLLAYGLADSAGRHVAEEWADLTAGSYRDGARVALSNPSKWVEILLDNRDAAGEALDSVITWAGQAREALRTGDRDVLTQLLGDAHQARKRFPR